MESILQKEPKGKSCKEESIKTKKRSSQGIKNNNFLRFKEEDVIDLIGFKMPKKPPVF